MNVNTISLGGSEIKTKSRRLWGIGGGGKGGGGVLHYPTAWVHAGEGDTVTGSTEAEEVEDTVN